MSYYLSEKQERLAKKVMYFRGQGCNRQECLYELERIGYPNMHVLVDSIFDRPVPTRKVSKDASR